MASGKHIGKVVLRVRKSSDDKISVPLSLKPHVYCDKSKSYIIVGGLGGLGLELADWLVLRGCKKLVITSSRGITNAYQESRIK
jgi:fatty acid synthase